MATLAQLSPLIDMLVEAVVREFDAEALEETAGDSPPSTPDGSDAMAREGAA